LNCQYFRGAEGGSRVIYINCEKCEHSSSLLDENCRENIFEILLKEEADKLILNHAFVKVFDNHSMRILKKLSTFIDNLYSIDFSFLEKMDEKCGGNRKKFFEGVVKIAKRDPIKAYKMVGKEKEKPIILGECSNFMQKYNMMIGKIIGEGIDFIGNKESEFYYVHEIQPYIRPVFFDTYIQFSPPSDAVFIKKYEIGKRRKIQVSLYSFSTRPEKLYFVIPPEYKMDEEEIKILQKVKEKLAKHKPPDTSFINTERAREYFRRFAKEEIKRMIEEGKIEIEMERVDMMAEIFAKYTSGLGILEDLLEDENIQDIYINAPVSNNPLHIVWNGEEYTTNIYLSERDVEALSSRFRLISGRPFSEASPVLDMSLEGYRARIAAISNPLTPKGIAFAIRRHSMTPWTLPKLVSKKMLTSFAAGLLSFLVDGQATILIAGSRGAGKTSLLSSLILEIPQRFRILIIEDTPEIPVDKLQRLGYKIQSLLTHPITGEGGVKPETALRTALRLGESVLILGEVRGEETKILFEAMRIGAAGNVVLGTIHGATTRDVFERIVHDIGVTPSSFKATDVVVVASPIRSGGRMEKKRRVIQITEVVKSSSIMDAENLFRDIMVYDSHRDLLIPTDILDMGQSEVIGRISRDWGISVEEAIQNINLRKKIKERIVKEGKKDARLLEAEAVKDANNAFWILIEDAKGKINYEEIERKWMEWYDNYIK